MTKKYIVRLSDTERQSLLEITKKLKGGSEKVRRANILLKADVDGPNWNDSQIAAAFNCSPLTVGSVRRRLVENGFEAALNRAQRKEPPTPKKLDGRQEAEIIALRLGVPPKGHSAWSLRLLADRVVELSIVDSISHETVRKTLKKTGLTPVKSSIG